VPRKIQHLLQADAGCLGGFPGLGDGGMAQSMEADPQPGKVPEGAKEIQVTADGNVKKLR